MVWNINFTATLCLQSSLVLCKWSDDTVIQNDLLAADTVIVRLSKMPMLIVINFLFTVHYILYKRRISLKYQNHFAHFN